jgi:hypothetical protein
MRSNKIYDCRTKISCTKYSIKTVSFPEIHDGNGKKIIGKETGTGAVPHFFCRNISPLATLPVEGRRKVSVPVIEGRIKQHDRVSNIMTGTGTDTQGCGSGLIQSGSAKFLNPDPMRIRIHNGKFEDKFFLQVLKINIKVKILVVCTISYLLAIKMFNKLRKSAFFFLHFPCPWIRIRIHKVIESGSTNLLLLVPEDKKNLPSSLAALGLGPTGLG